MSDCTCVRGDDGQVRVPRSRCPQHGWADTPTPAPALTDEQIDALRRYLYITVAGCSERLIDPQDLDLLYNAVIARAKREERERIGDDLNAWLESEYAPPIWFKAVDIADATWCDRHPEEVINDFR